MEEHQSTRGNPDGPGRGRPKGPVAKAAEDEDAFAASAALVVWGLRKFRKVI
jgi:hypothetical protein